MPTLTPSPPPAADEAEIERPKPAAGGKPSPGWPTSRKIGTGFAAVGAAIGVLVAVAGLALIGLHGFARDADGYYDPGSETLQSDRFAISAERLDLGADPGGPAPTDLLGDLRIKAESPDDSPLFVGIAPTNEVDRYLRGVGHTELTDIDGGDPVYEQRAGDERPKAPGAERFWAASSQGPGEQQVDWDAADGVWSAVVMNADGSRGVVADASAGVRIGWLIWVGIGLAAFGAVLVTGATALIIGARRRAAGTTHR